MGKFDTHGGYFAPQGYLRINTGGSHDENPNGGVQLGVDNQGVPNLLEEGEPVYNDYVYSDNIKADGGVLKRHNIPEKYAGKLYSEIADEYVDEAEERPNDPISYNGLNAMLVRLADAQDEQKQLKEQRELEEELASLSPEELAELEGMLSQQGAVPAEQNVQVPIEGMEQAQMVPPQQMPVPQMMASGGFIRRLDEGTPGRIVVPNAPPDTGTISEYVDLRTGPRRWLDNLIDNSSALRTVQSGLRNFSDSVPGAVIDFILPDFSDPVTALAFAGGAGKIKKVKKGAKAASAAAAKKGKKAVEAAKEAAASAQKATAATAAEVVPEVIEAVPETVGAAANKAAEVAESAAKTLPKHTVAGHAVRTAFNPFYVGQRIWKGTGAKGWSPVARIASTAGGGFVGALPATATYTGMGKGVDAAFDTWRNPWAGEPVIVDEEQPEIDFGDWDYADGGLVRKFEDGTPGKIYKENGVEYLPGDFSDEFGIFLGYDNNGIPIWNKMPTAASVTTKGLASVGAKDAAGNTNSGNSTTVGQESTPAFGMRPLPTFPRYAGALTSGLLGLYNVFQKPDEYNIRQIQPVLPSGQMDLIDPRYNPLDVNMAINDVLASGAGTVRALRNSGLGPSTGMALIAANNTTGQNIGDAFTRVRDANNQRRNDVIAQRNANAQALGQFNYGIDSARAQMLNNAQIRNIQNDLIRQRLNYDAEGQKYAAIANQIDQVGQALSGIGTENFRMNQINGNPAFDYVVLPDGRTAYVPKGLQAAVSDTDENKRFGGTLLRKYKK